MNCDIEWIEGNGEELPFEDNSFDAYTISFGIRNVTDKQKALNEAFRVLRPGGHFLCLEFSEVPNRRLRQIYDAYSFHIIPKVGKLIVGDASPYDYLVESIRRFPDAPRFAKCWKVQE
jgi:demethylmenaquinone methyltransferase/2-methoxy-6-polyprenyl-1,4-benzoquinol methylase